jgi:serine/threonine-protein kinase
LDELAGAILDGTPIDWAPAESGPEAARLRLLTHLKVVAALAAVHRDSTPPVESSTSNAPPLECWGHLRLLEQVGRGSFGEVYRAWDTRLDREVALKLLPADRASGEEETQSIIHEGRLLARVRHPNVLTIHGAEQIGGQIGLWTEFVRGETLEALLSAGTVFTPAQVTEIGVDLCRAVGAVHAAGLLHRDIKANNVTRAIDGRIVLMDFGAGRDRDDGSASDLRGTPLYLAPEVLRGEPATIQSDLYSLGVLLFRLLTGVYPVSGQTVAEIKDAHQRGERRGLREMRVDLPSGLSRVVERAIDPLPERRYKSAQSLTADLESLAHGPRAWVRSHGWQVAAASVLLLAALSWVGVGRDGMFRRTSSAAVAPLRIAVLPFENLSPGTESDDVVVGLTAEIIRNLAAIEGLETRSAGSSVTDTNQPRVLAAMASDLGVAYVLEGSLQRAGERLRVNAKLTRTAGNVTLWAGKFDRHMNELLAIQDEIALAIVNELRLKLGRGQRRYEPPLDIYYPFLQASGAQLRRDAKNSARAAELLEQIVDRAPDFAPAWAALASAASQLSRLDAAENLPPQDPRLVPAALRAMELDPLLPEAHAALGTVFARDRDWTRAEASFQRALELNPTLTTVHTDFVLTTLLPQGKLDEALRYLEAARAVDPRSLDVRRVLALVQVDAEQFDAAIESARWVLDRDPTFPFARNRLGRALALSGRVDEAVEIFKQGDWGYLGYAYGVLGRRAEAEALVAKYPNAHSSLLLVYAGLGDKDRTFEALEQVADVNWWRAATWMRRPELALLRGDPRLTAIAARLGVPE